ncbi:MAG: pyrroline-5-carboxylate reductase [Verrucomicrobiales bacterium]|nr:pyrroline-5-carboxylate reductase [Verrucomicrobiales bacterium]
MGDMKLGVIGCGKMGAALVRGVVQQGACEPSDVYLYDSVVACAEALAGEIDGAVIAEGALDVAESADVVLVCVKPHNVVDLLGVLAGVQGDPLFVSIAAGVMLGKLESALGGERRVVRVMPNTPALVGEGAAAFSKGSLATHEDGNVVEALLGSVGLVKEVPEGLIDAVTGVSGSGPAYIYQVIEAMADGGVKVGLPRDTAYALAAQTVKGAAAMVLETGLHPGVLKDQVTSPGGTTIAALAELEASGVRSAFIEAVGVAAARSKEMG